jgi:hypothetical protein
MGAFDYVIIHYFDNGDTFIWSLDLQTSNFNFADWIDKLKIDPGQSNLRIDLARDCITNLSFM